MPLINKRSRRKPHSPVGLNRLNGKEKLRGVDQKSKGSKLLDVIAFVGKKAFSVRAATLTPIEDHHVPIGEGSLTATAKDYVPGNPYRPHWIDRYFSTPRFNLYTNIKREQFNLSKEREAGEEGQRQHG